MAALRFRRRFTTFTGRINLTPMVDIVFQLIVFFMVASNLATVQQEPVNLPDPVRSQAREKTLKNRLLINLFTDDSGSGKITKIKANSDVVRDLPALVDLILRYGPRLQAGSGTVVIRADKRIHFSEVEGVLQAVGNAGVTSVHVAAEQDETAGQGTS